MARIALQFVSVPVNSVNAERSFRVYKIVVRNRHHNKSERDISMLLGMYYNTCNEPDTAFSD